MSFSPKCVVVECHEWLGAGAESKARKTGVQVLALAPNSWGILSLTHYFLGLLGTRHTCKAQVNQVEAYEALMKTYILAGTKQPNEHIGMSSSTKSWEEK